MSDEQPEESLDDIMAGLEEQAKKIGRPTNRPPLPRATRQPMAVPARKAPEPALPAPEEHKIIEAQYDQLLEQVEPQSNPVQVEQYRDDEPEEWVRNVPMPTGWILPLSALLVCVLVFGGLALYVWSHLP